MAQVDRDGLSFRAASMRGIGEREPGLVVVWEAEVRTGRRLRRALLAVAHAVVVEHLRILPVGHENKEL